MEDAVFGIWNRLKSFPTEGFEEATTLAYQKLVSLPEGTPSGTDQSVGKKSLHGKTANDPDEGCRNLWKSNQIRLPKIKTWF